MKDEHILISKARAGDMSAFRKIVERYKKTIYFFALNMTADHHDAEDITQEVFVKLFRSLKGFREEAKLRTWLYRITVNTCLDKRRKRSYSSLEYREQSSIEESLQQENSTNAHFENPEKFTEAGQMGRHIEEALNSISPKERAVFVLRHYSDLPLKDIAGVLNISIGTVKSLLFRAIRKLQKELSFYTKEMGLENIK